MPKSSKPPPPNLSAFEQLVKLAAAGQLPEAADVLEAAGFTRGTGNVAETQEAVARFFGVEPRTVVVWAASPGWPVARPGKGQRTAYPLADIARWIVARQKQENGALGGDHGDSDALEEWRRLRVQREHIALLKDRDEVVFRRDAELCRDTLVGIVVTQATNTMQELQRRFPEAGDDIFHRFEEYMRRVRENLTIAAARPEARRYARPELPGSDIAGEPIEPEADIEPPDEPTKKARPKRKGR